MTMIDAVTGELCIWVVYDSPSDYPGQFVARMFVLDKPTQTVLTEPTLGDLRALLLMLYPDLYCIPRQADDEPQIIEVWL
jgi:hypothetical protein